MDWMDVRRLWIIERVNIHWNVKFLGESIPSAYWVVDINVRLAFAAH